MPDDQVLLSKIADVLAVYEAAGKEVRRIYLNEREFDTLRAAGHLERHQRYDGLEIYFTLWGTHVVERRPDVESDHMAVGIAVADLEQHPLNFTVSDKFETDLG